MSARSRIYLIITFYSVLTLAYGYRVVCEAYNAQNTYFSTH